MGFKRERLNSKPLRKGLFIVIDPNKSLALRLIFKPSRELFKEKEMLGKDKGPKLALSISRSLMVIRVLFCSLELP